MKSEEQWIEEKIKEFERNPLETLFELYNNQIGAVEQFMESDNRASRTVLKSSILVGQKLIKEIIKTKKYKEMMK